MEKLRSPRALTGAPLVVQIWALLLGGLVAAQLVTMLLTLMLPPEPKPQHSLGAVVAALKGEPTGEDRPDHLERTLQAVPPDLSGATWLPSDSSRRELASALGVNPDAVWVAFYTPLPLAGTGSPQPRPVEAGLLPSIFALAQMPGGGFPGGMPGGMPPMPPPTTQPFPEPMPQSPPPPPSPSTSPPPPTGTSASPPPQPAQTSTSQPPSGSAPPAPGQGSPPPLPPAAGPLMGGGQATVEPPPPIERAAITLPERVSQPEPRGTVAAAPERQILPAAGTSTAEPAASTVSLPAPRDATGSTALAAAAPVSAAARPAAATARRAGDPATTAPPQPRGLFGLAPAPYLEGYFVAAVRLADGRWAVVHPAPEPFPTTWQRRVILWFLLAFAVVAPVGWWFARRLAKPLTRFAVAAEQLGRDPGAEVLELHGPAEVGRAARAFNVMQTRLRSYVDDRTAMIGAISHDLRTPLTRLRFRLEEIEDEGVRESMVGEVEEMEAMIASVLDFLRGASSQGVREIADLGDLVGEVVRQQSTAMGQIVLDESERAFVDVDRLGMRRLIANLLENAVKYGERATVRVRAAGSDALLEVIDGGPGLREEELERAFEPFYRSSDPKLASKSGTGLGLAICRSVARAHGGDVKLVRSEDGFTARLWIPLACEEPGLEAA